MEKKTTIEIHDQNHSHILEPRLEDLLLLLPVRYRKMHWSMLWFDAVGMLKSGQPMLEFAREVENSENGKSFTFESLCSLGTSLNQILETKVVAYGDAPAQLSRDNLEEVDLVLELFDSSHWVATTSDPEVLAKLRNAYRDVRPAK